MMIVLGACVGMNDGVHWVYRVGNQPKELASTDALISLRVYPNASKRSMFTESCLGIVSGLKLKRRSKLMPEARYANCHQAKRR